MAAGQAAQAEVDAAKAALAAAVAAKDPREVGVATIRLQFANDALDKARKAVAETRREIDRISRDLDAVYSELMRRDQPFLPPTRPPGTVLA